MANADDNRLSLQRSLWLDFDHAGYTAVDHLSGSLRTGWRLDMAAPWTLGSAKLNDEPLLVTHGERDALTGVELRTPEHTQQTVARSAGARGALPATGWSFTSNEAAACLTANPQPTSGPPSAACDSFKFNTPDKFASPPPPATNTPDNICRQFAQGNEPGQSVNGNDNAANLLAIQQLNDQLVGANGMLTKLPDSDPMAIWKNYEMIGALWTKGGASSGNAPVPNAGGPADPTSPQRGSLELANMSMETFQQGATSYIPNCFGCHNFNTATPLNVSHICDNLFSVDSTGKNCVIPRKGENMATAPAAPAAAEKK